VTPYPLDPVDATGPMRLVVVAFPSREVAEARIDEVLTRRLAACASHWPIESHFWWHNARETSPEVLVLFKTVPKRVGGLFRYLKETHPYHVPEILELDVPRVEGAYLRYLAETLDAASAPPPLGGGRLTHRVRPKAPASRRPVRNRAPHRRRWKRTGRRS
jgi:periplasmic divalent cation tolerance protein